MGTTKHRQRRGELTVAQLRGLLEQWMQANGLVKEACAELLGVGSAELSWFFNGDKLKPKLARAISRAVQRSPEFGGAPGQEPFVMTSVARSLWGVLLAVDKWGGLGCVLAPAGAGKTIAVREFLRRNALAQNGNGWPRTYLGMRAGGGTKAFVRLVCAARGLSDWHETFNLQRDFAKDALERGGLLIVDEADFVPGGGLAFLRQVCEDVERDYGHFGVVFVGTLDWPRRLRAHDRKWGCIEQLTSRFAYCEIIEGCSDADIEAIGLAYGLDEAACEVLVRGAGGSGRRAVTAIRRVERVRRGRISAEAIEAAFARLPDLLSL